MLTFSFTRRLARLDVRLQPSNTAVGVTVFASQAARHPTSGGISPIPHSTRGTPAAGVLVNGRRYMSLGRHDPISRRHIRSSPRQVLASTRRIASSRRRIASSRRQIVSGRRSGPVHRTTAVTSFQVSFSHNARYRSWSRARAIRWRGRVAWSRLGPIPCRRVPFRGSQSTMFPRFSVIRRRPSAISECRGVSCSDPECRSGRRRSISIRRHAGSCQESAVSTRIPADLLCECRTSDRELAGLHSIPSVSCPAAAA